MVAFRRLLRIQYKGMKKLIIPSIKRIYRDYAISRSSILNNIPEELKSGVGKRFCFSKEYRFLYFRIPKSANSTITNSLAGAIFTSMEIDDKGINAKSKFDNISSLYKLNEEEILSRFFCFTFVRNPYSRVLSAFLDKIDKENSSMAKRAGIPDRTGFPGFLEYLANGGLNRNPHWAPQTNLIPIAPEKLNFVGRVENLEQDFGKISRKIFGSSKPLFVRNSGRKFSESRFSDFYNSKEKDLVKKLYSDDFKRFYSE